MFLLVWLLIKNKNDEDDNGSEGNIPYIKMAC